MNITVLKGNMDATHEELYFRRVFDKPSEFVEQMPLPGIHVEEQHRGDIIKDWPVVTDETICRVSVWGMITVAQAKTIEKNPYYVIDPKFIHQFDGVDYTLDTGSEEYGDFDSASEAIEYVTKDIDEGGNDLNDGQLYCIWIMYGDADHSGDELVIHRGRVAGDGKPSKARHGRSRKSGASTAQHEPQREAWDDFHSDKAGEAAAIEGSVTGRMASRDPAQPNRPKIILNASEYVAYQLGHNWAEAELMLDASAAGNSLIAYDLIERRLYEATLKGHPETMKRFREGAMACIQTSKELDSSAVPQGQGEPEVDAAQESKPIWGKDKE